MEYVQKAEKLKQIDWYDVINNFIPNRKNNQLKKYLETNVELLINNPKIIQHLYASSIAETNDIATSLINLFVRENNIRTNRMCILENIYYANASAFYRGKGIMYTLIDFDKDDEISSYYVHKYWNIFDVK